MLLIRRSACRLLVAALVAPLGIIAGSLQAEAAPIRTEPIEPEVTSTELDLTGVDAGALAELPAADSVPFAEDGDAAVASPPSSTAETPDADGQASPPADPDVLTAELSTDGFSVLGVTWDASPELDGVTVRYRVRIDDSWTDWQAVESSDVAPDVDSDDADSLHRDGTDPIVAVGADGVQIWADAERGEIRGLSALLIDPGTSPQDASPATTTPQQASARSAVAAVGAPGIISRAAWGADESLKTCSPDYSNEMVSAAVHHTASANGYGPDAVPGLLRGFLAYHTRAESAGGRGWCDIGYNFLVDQYGRVFEGRAGGIDRTVVGVHTGGFNSRTIGIAAIGTYSTYAPSAALLESLSQLIAWKFSIHGISASGSATMVSGGGASKFPAGTVVTFPTIYAHRDAQLTSCPGDLLYGALPSIRARVAQISDAAVALSPRGRVEEYTPTAAGVRVTGWAFDPEADTSLTISVSVDGAVQTLLADRARPDVAQAFGVGPRHGFSGVIGAAHGTHVVCVTAVNIAGGGSTLLGCRSVTVTNPPPIGSFESATATTSSITVSGWALDPDTNDPISVHVYVDGVGTAVTADRPRPDVAGFGRGTNHGFSLTLPATGGTHTICVNAINIPAGANPGLGCRTVSVGAPPIGSLEGISTTASSVTVSGWALDPDTNDPISVHVYVDGVGTAVTADRPRPDVAGFGRGTNHGFSLTLPATGGTHTICAYAINTPSGPPTALGCRSVTVTNPPPIGSFESATATTSSITVSGWALDPDTNDPISVHVYVDGVGTAVTADRPRPDVAGFGRGTNHGFSLTLPATGGTHTICINAINIPAGANPGLGCRTVSVGAPPIGSLEGVSTTASSVTVSGWALDPDTNDPISVHVYVDGVGTAVTADRPRPDVAGFGRGTNHGFSLTLPATGGTHTICAYAINTPSGPPTALGCR